MTKLILLVLAYVTTWHFKTANTHVVWLPVTQCLAAAAFPISSYQEDIKYMATLTREQVVMLIQRNSSGFAGWAQ